MAPPRTKRMHRMFIPVLLAFTLHPALAQRATTPEAMLELRERMPQMRPTASPRATTGRLKAATVDTSSEAYRLLDAAYTALREEDLDRAVENFEKAIPLQPERTDIRKDLAYTYLRIGENELGRRQFEKVAELDPKDYRSQLELAFLDYDTGQIGLKAKARELFVAVARDGDAEAQATARGALNFIDADTAVRIAPFLRAVELDPNDSIAHFRIGLAREERNEYRQAIEAYRTTLRLAPGSIRVMVGLGRCFIGDGQRDEAIRILQIALQYKDDLFANEEARELLASLGVQ